MTDLIHSPEPDEALAAAAHREQEDIKADLRLLRRMWIELAAKLHAFQDGQRYRALGYRTFEEWLAQPEIGLGKRNAYFYIETYRTLVVENGLDPRELDGVNITNARAVLPAVRAGQVDVSEAVADARSLTVGDLHEKYRPQGAGAPAPGEQPIDAAAGPEIVPPLDPQDIPPSPPQVLPPERRVCETCGRDLA